MIGRTNRFHGHGSLRRVYKDGVGVRGAHIGLKYLQRTNNKPYRAAVVISRKVHKSAVVRARIRRRIYEIIRTSKHTPPNTDMIFTIFSDSLANIETAKLTDMVESLLKKASKTPN